MLSDCNNEIGGVLVEFWSRKAASNLEVTQTTIIGGDIRIKRKRKRRQIRIHDLIIQNINESKNTMKSPYTVVERERDSSPCRFCQVIIFLLRRRT